MATNSPGQIISEVERRPGTTLRPRRKERSTWRSSINIRDRRSRAAILRSSRPR